jgi:hypothetical protein
VVSVVVIAACGMEKIISFSATDWEEVAATIVHGGSTWQ